MDLITIIPAKRANWITHQEESSFHYCSINYVDDDGFGLHSNIVNPIVSIRPMNAVVLLPWSVCTCNNTIVFCSVVLGIFQECMFSLRTAVYLCLIHILPQSDIKRTAEDRMNLLALLSQEALDGMFKASM